MNIEESVTFVFSDTRTLKKFYVRLPALRNHCKRDFQANQTIQIRAANFATITEEELNHFLEFFKKGSLELSNRNFIPMISCLIFFECQAQLQIIEQTNSYKKYIPTKNQGLRFCIELLNSNIIINENKLIQNVVTIVDFFFNKYEGISFFFEQDVVHDHVKLINGEGMDWIINYLIKKERKDVQSATKTCLFISQYYKTLLGNTLECDAKIDAALEKLFPLELSNQRNVLMQTLAQFMTPETYLKQLKNQRKLFETNLEFLSQKKERLQQSRDDGTLDKYIQTVHFPSHPECHEKKCVMFECNHAICYVCLKRQCQDGLQGREIKCPVSNCSLILNSDSSKELDEVKFS